jgi:hypothetical protein
LAQTRNPPCRAIAAQERETQASSSSELSDTIFDETPSPDGDFFGAYDANEMPWPSPRFRATHLDADDEGDVLMDGSRGRRSSVTDSQGRDESDESDEDEGGRDDSDNEEEVVHEEGGTDVSVVVQTFPGAGMAIERGSGSLYKEYSNNYQEDNMYAPFKSQLDWDFARWAKLRGPGSTSTNELLNIDGVSIICFKVAVD